MEFPDWVKGPTACATRTFSLVLPFDPEHPNWKRKIISTFPNRPLTLVRSKRTGRLDLHWADAPIGDTFELVED
jgi:hypothetical protein